MYRRKQMWGAGEQTDTHTCTNKQAEKFQRVASALEKIIGQRGQRMVTRWRLRVAGKGL